MNRSRQNVVRRDASILVLDSLPMCRDPRVYRHPLDHERLQKLPLLMCAEIS